MTAGENMENTATRHAGREHGGSGRGNLGGVEASPFGWNFKTPAPTLTLPPPGAVFFKPTN